MDKVGPEKAKQNLKDMERDLKVSLEKAAEIFYKKQEDERKQAEEELRLKQEREKKQFEEFLLEEQDKLKRNQILSSSLDTPPEEKPSTLNIPPEEKPSTQASHLDSSLECPVCYETMKPPRKIWQCSSGHALCGVCYINPAIKRCPTCRSKIIGRNIGMEKITAALFRKPAEKRKAPDDTFEENVEKIFIGKEMNPAKRKKVGGIKTGTRIVRCANARRGCKKLLINDNRLKEHVRRCPFSGWYWIQL